MRAATGIRPVVVVGRSLVRSGELAGRYGSGIEPWTLADLKSRAGEIDLIACCPPNAAHERVTRELLDVDAAILLEKPLTTGGPADEQALLSDLSARNRQTWIDFPLRHLDAVREMMEVIDEAHGSSSIDVAIGIETGVVHRYGATHWKSDPAVGGIENLVLPHAADLVLSLASASEGGKSVTECSVDAAEAGIDSAGRVVRVHAAGGAGRLRYQVDVTSRPEVGFGERLTLSARQHAGSICRGFREPRVGGAVFQEAIAVLLSAVEQSLQGDADASSSLAGPDDALAADAVSRHWLRWGAAGRT